MSGKYGGVAQSLVAHLRAHKEHKTTATLREEKARPACMKACGRCSLASICLVSARLFFYQLLFSPCMPLRTRTLPVSASIQVNFLIPSSNRESKPPFLSDPASVAFSFAEPAAFLPTLGVRLTCVVLSLGADDLQATSAGLSAYFPGYGYKAYRPWPPFNTIKLARDAFVLP